MNNPNLRSLNLDLSQRDVRYILHAIDELMSELKDRVAKDPDGEEDITPMFAEDILHLRDISKHIKEKALPVFGEDGLKVSYELL